MAHDLLEQPDLDAVRAAPRQVSAVRLAPAATDVVLFHRGRVVRVLAAHAASIHGVHFLIRAAPKLPAINSFRRRAANVNQLARRAICRWPR